MLPAGALNAGELLPWVSGVAVLSFYVNDVLSTINAEHRYVLRLIDENSPRISAVEDGNDAAATDSAGPGVPTLRAHNLGAVKFIDGDGTEYVSKVQFVIIFIHRVVANSSSSVVSRVQ